MARKIYSPRRVAWYVLGRQDGGYVVQDLRTGSIQCFLDKKTATQVFNDRLANIDHRGATLRHPAPVPPAAGTIGALSPDDQAEILHVLGSDLLRRAIAEQRASERRLP